MRETLLWICVSLQIRFVYLLLLLDFYSFILFKFPRQKLLQQAVLCLNFFWDVMTMFQNNKFLLKWWKKCGHNFLDWNYTIKN